MGRILRLATFELLVSAKPEAGNWGYGFYILNYIRARSRLREAIWRILP